MYKDESLYSYDGIQEDVLVQNLFIHTDIRYNRETPTLIDGCSYKNIRTTFLDSTLGDFKCVRKMINLNGTKGTEINNFTRELYFLSHLKNLHPNIVEIYGWTNNYILMEFIENSSLSVMLKKKSSLGFNGTQKTKIALGVAHTIDYLHKLGIVHCDLSLNNILIDKNYEPKICDFGNTKYLSEKPNHVGTLGYIGPEIFPNYNYTKNTPKSDIYGFGGILWVLALEETVPVERYVPKQDVLNFDKIQDKYIRFLIKSCRAYHPDQRFTFDMIIKLIIDGKFVFPGTDFDEVKEYYDRLKEQTKDISEFEP